MGRSRYKLPPGSTAPKVSFDANVRRITVVEYQRGSGNAGTRFIVKQDFPNFRVQNPSIEFKNIKQYEDGQPFAVIEMKDGTQKRVELFQKPQSKIREELVSEAAALALNVDGQMLEYLAKYGQL